jgi:hypothetical protein
MIYTDFDRLFLRCFERNTESGMTRNSGFLASLESVSRGEIVILGN